MGRFIADGAIKVPFWGIMFLESNGSRPFLVASNATTPLRELNVVPVQVATRETERHVDDKIFATRLRVHQVRKRKLKV